MGFGLAMLETIKLLGTVSRAEFLLPHSTFPRFRCLMIGGADAFGPYHSYSGQNSGETTTSNRGESKVNPEPIWNSKTSLWVYAVEPGIGVEPHATG